ncbi:MAG: hypothetical protein JNL87_11450 [Burkholderiaceae bacterium]|nr:hypothetical protein [Burkholderiaceae bacterium]
MPNQAAKKQGPIATGWPGGRPPPQDAFHVERIVDPFTLAEVVGMVRHAGHPWRARCPSDDHDAGWQAIGHAYLEALAALPGLELGTERALAQRLRDALAPGVVRREPAFGWLAVSWPQPTDASLAAPLPLGSYWVQRRDAAAGEQRTLVLLAANLLQPIQLQLGSDIGLRIALHLRGAEVHIHGVTLSGLSGSTAWDAVEGLPTTTKKVVELLTELREPIRQALDVQDFVRITNLERPRDRNRRDVGERWTASGLAAKQRGSRTRPPVGGVLRDFCVDLARDDADPARWKVVEIRRNDHLGSEARAAPQVSAQVFVADPASLGDAGTLSRRRPTRDAARLAGYRIPVTFQLGAGGELRDPAGRFETRSASPGGRSARAEHPVRTGADGVVELTLGTARSGAQAGGSDPPILSDLQGALDAHQRASELFGRFERYGIDAGSYFRFARLPLVQRIRPSMRWAPDGELPNAEVRPFIEQPDVWTDDAVPLSRQMQLLVKYGSADPLHRDILPLRDAQGQPTLRRKAQYLSVASDPRWAWHEFGHVINHASTGELELPFAHSAGDALGAIAADPLSGLVTEQSQDSPLRFVTFPWIEVAGRSHGRNAQRGHCWCGARNQVRLDFSASLDHYQHSYFGEQLLSSSLFRLYRSLGGDTRGADEVDDALTRLEASDYCIYLILRAVSLIGPDSIAPARTVDQFVSALIDADLGTGVWTVKSNWPLFQGRADLVRLGGQAHKVIRWAFERQGLYATADPAATAEGPGMAPAVDLFIADRRPIDGPDGERGGYAPVPLRSSDDELWHADPGAVTRDGSQLRVTIGNRGQRDAAEVGLRIWWASCARQPGRLDWSPGPVVLAPTGTVAARGLAVFTVRLTPGAPAGDLWVFIAADAPADPSNLGPGQPPPADPVALMKLVALDNNLALARLAAVAKKR